MDDARYQHPVNGMNKEVLAKRLRRAIREAQKALPPGTGITMFIFDFIEEGKKGGVAYISNARREDMVKMVQEWLSKVEPMS